MLIASMTAVDVKLATKNWAEFPSFWAIKPFPPAGYNFFFWSVNNISHWCAIAMNCRSCPQVWLNAKWADIGKLQFKRGETLSVQAKRGTGSPLPVAPLISWGCTRLGSIYLDAHLSAVDQGFFSLSSCSLCTGQAWPFAIRQRGLIVLTG